MSMVGSFWHVPEDPTLACMHLCLFVGLSF